jgi:iron complex transport system permease protein
MFIVNSNVIKKKLIMGAMISALISICIISISWGQVQVPLVDTISILLKNIGIANHMGDIEQAQEAVIWHIRMPRVLVGVLTGAALGVSGAVMQGIFSNPLADPGIIGVSGGAAFGAVLAVALGLSAQSLYFMPFFALGGAVLAVGIALLLSTRKGKIPIMVLLLAGITVSMFMGALTSGVLTFMNEHSLREFLFWTIGGLDYRRWEHVALAVGPITVGGTFLCMMARHINIMVLGEEEARALGVPVAKLRMILLLIVTLTTATAVCVSGSIGFVGLIVPHIMRLLLGPDHRILLPASAIAGALFLVSCDLVGRMILPVGEIRVGIITALLGAPYFLYLLHRMEKGVLR